MVVTVVVGVAVAAAAAVWFRRRVGDASAAGKVQCLHRYAVKGLWAGPAASGNTPAKQERVPFVWNCLSLGEPGSRQLSAVFRPCNCLPMTFVCFPAAKDTWSGKMSVEHKLLSC